MHAGLLRAGQLLATSTKHWHLRGVKHRLSGAEGTTQREALAAAEGGAAAPRRRRRRPRPKICCARIKCARIECVQIRNIRVEKLPANRVRLAVHIVKNLNSFHLKNQDQFT